MKRGILAGLAVGLLLAGALLQGCARLGATSARSSRQRDIRLQLKIAEADPLLANGLRTGDAVRFKETGGTLGTISSVTTTPSVKSVPTADGRLVEAEVPNQLDIVIMVAGSAVSRDDGYRFDGQAVRVNDELKLVTPLTYCKAVVISIEETRN